MGKHFKSMPGRFALLMTVTMFSAVVMMLPSASLAADRRYKNQCCLQLYIWKPGGSVGESGQGLFPKIWSGSTSSANRVGHYNRSSLVASDISFANVAGPAVIQSNLRGADTVIIAGVINTLTFQLYTEKASPDRINLRAKPWRSLATDRRRISRCATRWISTAWMSTKR